VTRIGELRTTLTVTSNRHTMRLTTFLCSVHLLLVTANIPSSPILVTLTMEKLRSSETAVCTRPTWYSIPEDDILQEFVFLRLKIMDSVIRVLPSAMYSVAFSSYLVQFLHVAPSVILCNTQYFSCTPDITIFQLVH
jgi:hypothetical protein